MRNRRAAVRIADRPRLSEYDQERLSALLESVRRTTQGSLPYAHWQRLEEKLNDADVFAAAEIPKNVVTMNSTVTLRDLDTAEPMSLGLAYPSSASVEQKRISILSPLGVRLLGAAVGDVIEYENGSGPRRYRVESIEYQPEAARDYHR